MKAINIIWDVDFEEDLENLPTEIEIPEGMTDEEEISDYITDVIGFCHKGFELTEKYGIMSIPTLILFKNGETAKRVTGARGKAELKAWVTE